MITPRPSFSELPVAEIVVPRDRLRVTSEAKVVALMDLITSMGFIGRITVRRAAKVNTLIDGAHRLEAVKRLGWSNIPTDVFECSLDEARQQEIAGNLVAGQTPLQDAIFLAAWQDQQEKLHPELKRGVAGGLARHGLQGALKTVADAVAEARQINARQVRRIIQAARQLTVPERTTLQSSDCSLPLDGIIAIGKLADGEERSAVIRKLALGAAKSVSAARRAYTAEKGGVAPIQDPIEEAFRTLKKAWERAPFAARKRFVVEEAHALWEANNRGLRPGEAE